MTSYAPECAHCGAGLAARALRSRTPRELGLCGEGEASERQVEGAKAGLTHVIGLGSACGVHVLERVSP